MSIASSCRPTCLPTRSLTRKRRSRPGEFRRWLARACSSLLIRPAAARPRTSPSTPSASIRSISTTAAPRFKAATAPFRVKYLPLCTRTPPSAARCKPRTRGGRSHGRTGRSFQARSVTVRSAFRGFARLLLERESGAIDSGARKADVDGARVASSRGARWLGPIVRKEITIVRQTAESYESGGMLVGARGQAVPSRE